MNFNPFPAIPRIARGQGISNLRGVYTVPIKHNCNILVPHVAVIVKMYKAERLKYIHINSVIVLNISADIVPLKV